MYLLCSDGLTTMVPEERVAQLLRSNPHLREAGEALIAAANEAGGRDNITVVLFRLEDPSLIGAAGGPDAEDKAPVDEPLASPATTNHAAAASALATEPVRRLRPRMPAPAAGGREARRRRRTRRATTLAVALVLLGLIVAGAYIAMQSVYFIGTNSRGLVTLYQGVPYQLPGGINLYSSDYVSGVSASTLPAARRHALLDHSLRSEGDAANLLRSLELGQLSE